MRRRLKWIPIILVLFIVPITLFLTGRWVPNEPAELQTTDRPTQSVPGERPARGIDVSRHQGKIDWAAVAASGQADFAYIKATEGRDWTDSAFARNWAAAGAAGVRRGAYHFFTLRSTGADQASHFIRTVPKTEGMLPPAVDLEFYGNGPQRPSIADFRRELETFIARVRDHYGIEPVVYTMEEFQRLLACLVGEPEAIGYIEPVVYTMEEFQREYLKDVAIPRLWIRGVVGRPSGFAQDRWTFWQYSAFGKIPGVKGSVDLNIFRGTSAELDRMVGGAPPKEQEKPVL